MQPTHDEIIVIEKCALHNPYIYQIYMSYRGGKYTWSVMLLNMVYVLCQVSDSQKETLEYILQRMPYHIDLPVKEIIIP